MSVRSLRILADSLPSIVATGAAGMLALMVWQVVEAAEVSKRVHILEEVILAACAAEEAAFDAAGQDLDTTGILQLQSSTGMLCSVSLSSVDTPAETGPPEDVLTELVIEVRGRNQRYYTYRCDLLAGAAPEALGRPLSIRKTVLEGRRDLREWVGSQPLLLPTLMTDSDLPQLVATPSSGSAYASRQAVGWRGLRRDDSLALLRTPSGTDLKDHVFVVNGDGVCRPRVPRSGTIRLPGHLWLDRDRDRKPLVIELSRALTVVARGNIYIGTSLRVTGPGKLLLVAQRGESELFVDRDADGLWSEGDTLLTGDRYQGPVEGTGAIYLGLPAQDADPHHPQNPVELTIAASLHAQGEVHLLARRAEIHGALVMEQGITRFGKPALVLPGDRLPNTQRERVPGFRTKGDRRPGLLSSHR